MDDDIPTVPEKVLKRTYRLTKDTGGIFGINVMVSAEVAFIDHPNRYGHPTGE